MPYCLLSKYYLYKILPIYKRKAHAFSWQSGFDLMGALSKPHCRHGNGFQNIHLISWNLTKELWADFMGVSSYVILTPAL